MFRGNYGGGSSIPAYYLPEWRILSLHESPEEALDMAQHRNLKLQTLD
ncbi:MAG: hypothetical protein MZV64_70100 [Ignavibacteriales bacterium]|nr:hypothetical protein [Ignavibacteriales bacterium]